MGMAANGFCPPPAQACRGTNGVRSPVLPQQSFSYKAQVRRKANDQRLCLPRLPASVPGFSIAVL